MATDLQNLSNELAETVARAAGSIVAVQARRGIGSSGIAWRDNLILTTSEGVRGEEGIKLLLPDGKVATARLRGRDSGTDLALLEAEGVALPPLEFAADASLKAGQFVLAVGRTANTGPIASFGIISGVSGEWKTWRGGKLDPFVRLDVSGYPTLSGGAALDAQGHLIGLVSTGLSRSSVFAVTRGTIERIAGRLSQHGTVSRGFRDHAAGSGAGRPGIGRRIGDGRRAGGGRRSALRAAGRARGPFGAHASGPDGQTEGIAGGRFARLGSAHRGTGKPQEILTCETDLETWSRNSAARQSR
jgi:Trypsin-like peptidase domain